MKNSETGEFEMAVGNRHLIGGFLVVVLLMGVAFAMGYSVGQNTLSARAQAPAQPAPAVSRPRQAVPVPLEPARQVSPDANAEAIRAQAATSEEKAAVAPARQAVPAEASAPAVEPAPGTYWQVKALRKSQAEVMVRRLKDMGLPAVMSPSPAKPALMRVLVGPYSDTETMGRAKARLEKAGLPPIPNHLK